MCLIIGGGASGVLTALELLKRKSTPLRLCIVDPNSELGRGRAYPRSSDHELLNVPAAHMSADCDHPSEFVDWLTTTHGPTEQFSDWPYVPRALYGEYLNWKLAAFIGAQLTHKKARVTKFDRRGGIYQVELSDGEGMAADLIVICTGYVAASAPVFGAEFKDSPKNKRILIIGSGLTAIDHWRAQRFRGANNITFMSRHGLFPLPHLAHVKRLKLPVFRGMSPRQIMQVVRALQAAGKDQWQDIADALRPQAAEIWASWSNRERSQFIRHLKVYWEIMRHRIPANIHGELLADLRTGVAKVSAGRAEKPVLGASGLVQVKFRPRGEPRPTESAYDAVFDSSGAQIDQSLLSQEKKVAGLRASPLGLGFINDSAPDLWIVGPACKASVWEITAISEIKAQADQVAREILTAADAKSKATSNRLLIHPANVGESYLDHSLASLGLSWRLAKISLALLAHAVFPVFFIEYASDQIRNASRSLRHRRLLTRKSPPTPTRVPAETVNPKKAA